VGKSKDYVDEKREVQIKLYLWRDGSLILLLLGVVFSWDSPSLCPLINKSPSFRNEKEMEKPLTFSQKFHNMILHSNILVAT
jgi:hypothetical protein